MKKFLSILLAAMLILGMLPATALNVFAEGTYEKATSIAVGDTVVLVYVSGDTKKELSSISTSSTKYGVGVDFSSAPAGVMPLEVVAGSTSGTYAFKTSDKKYLYWTSGNSLNVNGTLNANTSWTVTFDNSGNATIKNAKDSSRGIRWNSSSPRFACYTSGQQAVQLYKLVKDSCEHTNFELQNKTDATCTTDGFTGNKYCLDCKKVFEEGTVIPADHNYENGICSVCGDKLVGYVKVTDVTTLEVTDEVVVTMTNSSGVTYALTNGGGTSAAPAATVVTVTNNVIENLGANAGNLVWNIEYSNGDIIIHPNGNANQWLYCTNTNNGVRVGTGDAKQFVIDDATGYLKMTHTEEIRYIGVYNDADWRCYRLNNNNIADNIKGQTLAFYKKGTNEVSEPVVEMGGKQYGSFEEAYAEDPDTPIKLLTDLEDITVTGDLYLDLNGFNADVDSANAVFLIDTTATNAKEGNGKLTTTSEVIVDYTANDVRYIALEDNGVYTAHVLELKLTAVTLRTTAAGIYYKAAIICDPTLAAAADTYGVVLSVYDMPGANFETEMNGDKFANGWSTIENKGENVLSGKGDKTITSGSVFNIFSTEKTAQENKERGETPIYASAYLKLKNGGTVVMSTNNTSFSMKGVLERVKSATLTEAQQVNINKFNQDWEDVLALWN